MYKYWARFFTDTKIGADYSIVLSFLCVLNQLSTNSVGSLPEFCKTVCTRKNTNALYIWCTKSLQHRDMWNIFFYVLVFVVGWRSLLFCHSSGWKPKTLLFSVKIAVLKVTCDRGQKWSVLVDRHLLQNVCHCCWLCDCSSYFLPF